MLSTYRPGTSVMTIGHLRGTKTINRTGETIVAKPERCLTPVRTPPLSIEVLASGNERLGGLTQFVSPSSVSIREQNGRTAGSLVSASIESNGNIVGLFSNGISETLARVSLASFSNAGGLKRQGENLFTQTESSGQPVVGTAESTVQSSIRAGAVELSNVNLAQEFTNMIVTQRGFQASARSITTSDELLAELVNLKR